MEMEFDSVGLELGYKWGRGARCPTWACILPLPHLNMAFQVS